jgi:hypothetical protein
MQKTKIRSDSHSLYVRINKQVYRPIPSVNSYPENQAVTSTAFHAQQLVRALHIPGTPFCRIKDDEGEEEWWHSHGTYIGDLDIFIDTENVWQPKSGF